MLLDLYEDVLILVLITKVTRTECKLPCFCRTTLL